MLVERYRVVSVRRCTHPIFCTTLTSCDTHTQDLKRWLDTTERALEDEGHGLMDIDQVQDVIKEKVTQNFQAFARAFADVDYARIGVVSKDDFKTILLRYAFRLSDDQVTTVAACVYACQYSTI